MENHTSAPELAWLAGTSGFSYRAWQGSFYPEDIAAKDMLAYYAARLPAVEINNTFYRMPRASVLAGWREQVPPTFRFAIKAPRRISHQAKLVDCEDAVAYFSESLAALGDQLGCVLLQLPPYLRKDAERLNAFLADWPESLPLAVEFRHASWFDAEIAETLAAHRTALCVSEDGKLALPSRFDTTDWLYFRLRKPGYEPAAMAEWIARAAATNAGRGFAFFKHEDAGAGPKLAAEFLELAGAGSAAPSPATDASN